MSATPTTTSEAITTPLPDDSLRYLPAEMEDLKLIVARQQKDIDFLLRKVALLEGNQCRQLADIAIAQHMSKVLSENLDDLQQYSKRSCVVVDGIPLPPLDRQSDPKINDLLEDEIRTMLSNELDIAPSKIATEFDKAHRIGPIDDNGNQAVIVKFKSHSFRSHIYGNRKKIQNKKIKIKISLTPERRKLLNIATEMTEENPNVDFVFADPNGNLKVKLKRRDHNNKMFFNFKSELDLSLILSADGLTHFNYEV